VNGERRTYDLLRPMTEVKAQDHIRDLVLSAYAKFEAEAVDDQASDAADEAAPPPW
jgi:hypothetical protein